MSIFRYIYETEEERQHRVRQSIRQSALKTVERISKNVDIALSIDRLADKNKSMAFLASKGAIIK